MATKKHKLRLIAFGGMIGVVAATWGWIRFGNIVYAAAQLISISVFLEALLFLYGVRHNKFSVGKYALHIASLVILGTAVGVFLFDIAGLIIFKIWEYTIYSPFSNPLGYLRISFVWGIYFLIFHQSYELLYHLLHRRHHHIPVNYPIKSIFSFIGPLGIVLMGIGFAFPALAGEPTLSAFIAFVGTWFVLEGFEFPKKRQGLLFETLSGNFRPWIAIVVGALIIGFLSEFANLAAPIQQWVYHDIPWKNITIFGVPLSLLLAWSTMYIIFLSLENILVRTDKNVWDQTGLDH